MGITRLKGLIWLGSLLIGGYLSWFVADFLRNRESLGQPLSQDDQREVLEGVDAPEPPRDDVVDYELVSQVFHQMNWTGREKRPAVVRPVDAEAEAPPAKAVADLLRILVVRVDTDAPEGSIAFVKYQENALIQAATKDPSLDILRTRDRLAAPYGGIRVAAIRRDGVLFEFDEEGREAELVAPIPFESERGRIVQVGEDGAILPVTQSRIAKAAEYRPWRPKETTAVGKNNYVIGTETIDEINRDYSRILSQDLRYKKYRDPRSGQVGGIEVTFVAPGSIPEGHGLQPGDVVKSINGHPVTSVNGAIAYVKKEAATTKEWIVVIANKGREFTRKFYSPQ